MLGMYSELVKHFLAWCINIPLILNVKEEANKAKEKIIDFRETRNKPNTISI